MQNIIKLDKKDKKILIELEKDARQSNKQIAKKVGANTDLVRYRINKLQEEGVVGWFISFVNFAKIGFMDYGIYITAQKLTKEKEKEFSNYFFNHKRVSYFAKLGGKYDFVIGILASDVMDFQQTLSEIMDKYGDYISNRDIAIRVHLFHFSKSYILDKKESIGKMPQFGGKVQVEKLDKLDQQILSELAINARINVVDLAKKIKTPASTISLRIKKLKEKNIIEGFFTFIRCQKYGYQNYLIHVSLKNLTKQNENKFYGFCKQHQNITYLIKTVGKWDYEISVEVLDQQKFQEVFTELREQFSDIIVNMESIILFQDLKYNLYPF
jgi:DNA-binding Lrp family transcriptional regulator